MSALCLGDLWNEQVPTGVPGERIKFHTLIIVVMVLLLGGGVFSGCDVYKNKQADTRTVTDQLGRQVKIPKHPKKIAALHHFGGKILYALGKKDLLVEQSIYGLEALALKKVDKAFAALPNMIQSHGYNIEGIVSLNPEIVFLYASMDKVEMELYENAGIPVVAVKGETFEESFSAIRLMADILECPQAGEAYIHTCQGLLKMVQNRLKNYEGQRLNVLFAGPKSIYSVATGNMIQTRILDLSGARNVACDLNGFWADVSPEQIAAWNPDVIFLGSHLDTYGKEKLFENSHFQTIKAIKDKKVYSFPSNIGWWDYPAPHCVLGVVWSAKTLYPDLFKDIDLTKLANDFYKKRLGYSFEELGGRLDP